MNWLGLLLPCMWLVSPAWAADNVASAPTGLQINLTFTEYTPLSSSAELVRRLLTPLTAMHLQQHAAAKGIAIREQPIDLSRERFALYVPDHMPPNGYGLLVFVPPWNDALVPPTWIPKLEQQGVILVTVANVGNDTNVLDRRDPLALLAAYNVMSRYRVDPERVYVGGLSGGSRVAQRLAMGYPDLFHGVLLNAGSDIVGDKIPIPPRELLYQFQTSTRVVYLTGENDTSNLDTDRASRQSFKHWCVTDIDSLTISWTGHELADAASLEHALASLDHHHPANANDLAACRARVDHELSSRLDRAEASIVAGNVDDARQRLQEIDAHDGGLAAPRSLELMQKLQGHP
ncbi:PHB depolymerase family esterase [Dyella sp. 20L07]|uniref:PHB depolymerase family esterase n=1 Tax=Dyella sp. 20L07 TaxID=3384240 RepID=UPI003D280338